MTIFYLGVHRSNWLGLEQRAGTPLFVSMSVLSERKSLPRATGPWALDSGGFTQLSIHGRWTSTPRAFAAEVRRLRDGVGSLDFVCPQDWVCTPEAVAKTGKSVREHLHLTAWSFLELSAVAPDLPWVPVLQGWDLADYLRCADLYERAGVPLRGRLVGVGSIAARQRRPEVVAILRTLAGIGLRLHGFGVKAAGLLAEGLLAEGLLASSDSTSWSYRARKNPPLRGCAHRNCANCLRYGLAWRRRLLLSVDGLVRARTMVA